MHEHDPLDEAAAPVPVELVQIAIPVLLEAVAAIFTVGVACMWVIIYATRVPTP